MQSSSKFMRILTTVSPRINSEVSRGYRKVAFRLKKNAAAAYANDGSGNHVHHGSQHCTFSDCASKKCSSVCGQPTKLTVDGHQTHNPPVGRLSRFISEHDANGDSKRQYNIKTNTKTEIDEAIKQSYGSQIKPDPKVQAFIDKYSDKYD